MFYIFNYRGHYAEKMAVKPPILPEGYFYLEAGDDIGEYLYSDGAPYYRQTSHLHRNTTLLKTAAGFCRQTVKQRF